MKRYPKHARLLTWALALVVGLTLVAPPAFAGGPAAAAPRPIANAAIAKVEAMPAAALAQAGAPATAATTSDKPFFKSTKGVVVLVLMATAVGWAVASRSQDAVHSPAR